MSDLNNNVLTFNQFSTLTEETHGSLEDAKNVIRILRQHGFKGYLVGGCVRDLLTGHKPKDFDVATDATPDQVVHLLPGASLVGKSFGVVVAHGIDIATFRKDGTYTDGRRPDSVEFTTDPKHDADRRDFTVNGMFMDPFTHEVLDFHGGKADVKNKMIRAIGKADDRFAQDHLRMLRADRFAAKLGFDIHPETRASMTAHSHHIANIDVERVTQELTKALAHDAGRTVRSMHQTGMLAHVLPELSHMAHGDIDTILKTVAFVPTNISVGLGLASVLFKLDSNTATKIGKRLKFDNVTIKHVVSIMDLQERISAIHPHVGLDVIKRLVRMPFFAEAMSLYDWRIRGGDHATNSHAFTFLSRVASGMRIEDLHPEKFVNGDDLKALGMKPGKEFAEILTKVETGQLTGEIKSKEQALEMIRTGRL